MPKLKTLLLSFIVAFQLFVPLYVSAAEVGLPCTPPTDKTQNSQALFTCVNQVYKYALVICSIAAIFMIILAGYMYIFSGGNEKRVATAKSFISTSLTGIVVLLTGFLLLKQINPNLLTLKNITPQQIGKVGWYDVDFSGPLTGSNPGTTYSGGKPVTAGQWKDLINSVSQQNNIDPCVLQAILDKESSGGKADAIGHDGGKTANENFSASTPPLHGLDWGHSHGIGLGQVTIFPNKNKWKDVNTPSIQWFRQWYTVADLLNPQTNLSLVGKIITSHLKDSNMDLKQAYGKYNGAGPNSQYVQVVMGYYNTCKASGGGAL